MPTDCAQCGHDAVWHDNDEGACWLDDDSTGEPLCDCEAFVPVSGSRITVDADAKRVSAALGEPTDV